MKKRFGWSGLWHQGLLIGGLALIIVSESEAQAASSAKWSVSLLGGGASASLSFEGPDSPVNVSARRGLAFGVELGGKLDPSWSWSVGAIAAQRGAQWGLPQGTASAQVEFRSYSLDVPLLVQRSVLRSSAVDVGLVGGVALSANGSGEVLEPGTDNLIANIDLRQFGVSGIVGAQANLVATRLPLFARVQYQHGFTNLTVEQPTARSRSFVFLVGATLKRW